MLTESFTRPERRMRVRRRTLLSGRICYGDRFVISTDCGIRNLTASGAMLQVSGTQLLPAEFTLLKIAEGVAYDVRIIWRNGVGVGVSLGERHDLKGAVSERLRPLRAIWAALAPT